MRIGVLGLLLGCLAAAGAEYQQPSSSLRGLQLEVNAGIEDLIVWGPIDRSDNSDYYWHSARVTVEIAVRNVSDGRIKVPTMSFFPQSWDRITDWGGAEQMLLFKVRAPRFDGKPTKVVEARYAPVVLEPGEVALVHRFVDHTRDQPWADKIADITLDVRFAVDLTFPEDLGWWRGALYVKRKMVRITNDPRKDSPPTEASGKTAK